MSRMSGFNSPLLLGFDHLERMLDSASRASAEGYPPYNIERISKDGLRISIAVAGFGREDLQILVEKNQLIVRGRQNDDEKRVYIHRGIAARQFQRSFVLAEGIEISDASLDNGLLHIELIRPQPEVVSRIIEIAAGPPKIKNKMAVQDERGKVGK